MTALLSVVRNENIKYLIEDAKKQFITILEEMSEGKTLFDEMGHLEVYNSAMEKLTGYSKEEASMFSDFTLFIYPDFTSRKQALDGFRNLVKYGDIHEMRIIINTKDKRQKTVLVSTKVITFNKRRLFISTYNDITDNKQIEMQSEKNTKTPRNVPIAIEIPKEKNIKKNILNSLNNTDLHRQREKRLVVQQTESSIQQFAKDMGSFLPEQQNHQNELEMQNENFPQTEIIKGTLVAEYTDLFEFAPISYIILDCNGMIRKVNLTGTHLLGVDQSRLINQQFSLFVSEDYRHIFNKFLEQVFTYNKIATCEVLLLSEGNSPFWVHIEAITSEEQKECRIVLRDMTEQKNIEKEHIKQTNLLWAINMILRDAIRHRTIQDAARTFLTVAEILTVSRLGFVGEVNKEGFFDTLSFSNPCWEVCIIPISNTTRLFQNMEINDIWGKTLKECKSQMVNNPASDPDKVRFPNGYSSITSFLGVPLKNAGKTIGMIALANKEGGYTTDDQHVIEILSANFIEVLSHKRYEENLKEASLKNKEHQKQFKIF